MSSLIKPIALTFDPDQTVRLITHGPASVDSNLTAGMMKNATGVRFLDDDGNEVSVRLEVTIDPAFRKSAAAGRKPKASAESTPRMVEAVDSADAG